MKNNILKELVLPAFWLLYFFVYSGNEKANDNYDFKIADLKKIDAYKLNPKPSFIVPNLYVLYEKKK